MNLNKEQLHQIKDFVVQRGFKDVDVQMEILDHVASSVEDKMDENPLLNFDAAISETHKSFGIMGFSTFANGITNSIRAKYSRLFWRIFFSAFGYKYVLLLCFSIFGIYKIEGLLTKDNFYMFFVLGMLLVFGVLIFSYINIQVSGYKKYLSFKSGNSFLSLLGVDLIFTNLIVNNTPSELTIFSINVQQLIVSFSIILFVLYFNAAIRTAKVSVRETKSLMEKYKLLYN